MKKLLLPAFLLLWIIGFSQEKIPFIDVNELNKEAAAFNSSGDYSKTLEILEKINKNDSTYCSALVSKSFYLLKLEKFEEAIEVVEVGLNRDCEDSNLSYLINKGVALESLERLDDANAHYENALKSFPRNAQLWNNKGIVLEKLERIEEAIKAYQRAIFYQPAYKTPHLRLGNISYRHGKMTQAILCFNTYLLLEPDAEDAFNTLSSLNNLVITKNPNTANPELSISADEDAFETIDLILENKLALNENYVMTNKINVPVIRQNHVLMDQLKNYEGTEGFWSQTYVPLYRWISQNDHFDDFAHTLAISIENEDYKKVIEKNEESIKSFIVAFHLKWKEILSNNTFRPDDEDAGMAYAYLNSNIEAVGKMEDKKTLGDWKFYNADGSYGGKGGFNMDGLRHGKWEWYYPNGITKEIAHYENGKLQGENRGFFKNGKPEYTATFNNDKLEREYKIYNENGALLQKKHYKAGELDGWYQAYFAVGEELPEFYIPYKKGKVEDKVFEYYANGDIFKEMSYKNGQKNGPEKKYNFNKSLFTEIIYENDLPVGEYRIYYSNGQLKEAGQYQNGLFHGAFKTFYADGTLQLDLSYDKGELEGLYRYYDTDGKLFYDYEYKKGKITGFIFYDKNGEVIDKGSKKGGEFFYKGYTPNGNIVAEGLYDFSGGKTGPWKFYTTNGVLEFEGEYLADEIVGEYREYHLNGKVKSISNYKNGELNGYFVEYYPNGNMKSQGWNKDGLRMGEWRDYYINGQLFSRNYYHKSNYHGEQEYYGAAGSLLIISTFDFGKAVKDNFYSEDQKLFETVDYKVKENKYVLSSKHFNGKKQSVTSFLNGIKHGPYEYFDFEGNRRLTGNYLNGSEHGIWTWYHANGQKERTANYVEGKFHGDLKDYYDTGVQENHFLYDFGRTTGKWFSYHENGVVATATDYYEDEQHGRKEFYSPTGKLQLVRFYDHGRLTGYSYVGRDGKEVPVIELPNETGVIKAYYDNGNISRQMEYRNGVLVDNYKAFYYSGQLENEIHYDHGNYNGSFTEFFPDGIKKTEMEYLQDHLIGKVRRFHENGKLKEETSYVNNRREGDSFHYDQNGKLIKKEEYLDDEVFSSEVL